jgi:aspartate/methionine/tyrosine aminotransferase
MDDKNPSLKDLQALKPELEVRYRTYQAQNLSIDMTRGKPGPEQLDLSLGMLECVKRDSYQTAGGIDCRNYGGLDGIPEAKVLFAEYLGVTPQEIIVGGSSSLNMMYDAVVRAMVLGVAGCEIPWGNGHDIKWLCPSPGYDRHFAVCQALGIEMITVGMRPDGPDMDEVERVVSSDPAVKGIRCVPKYSNPTGVVYSDQVVDRLASMHTAAPDFRIFWDNAYAFHHHGDGPAPLKNILSACQAVGNPDRPYLFGSTSKISFAGSGVAMMAGSERTIAFTKDQMQYQTIGPDKLNQLRHVRFFGDLAGIEAHMQKHAAILKPKFDTVLDVLDHELGDKGVARWSRPQGGYFVSLDMMAGCAREVVAKAALAGVKLTGAGATYPYKRDPQDRNIRIAPSLPTRADIVTAMEVLAVCILLVSIDKLH